MPPAPRQLDLDVPAPLADLVQACETVCMADCCGVDAYDHSPEAIAVWVRSVERAAAEHAVGQARRLAGEVGRHRGMVSSYPLFNLAWDAGPTAAYLREWATNTERALQLVWGERNRSSA